MAFQIRVAPAALHGVAGNINNLADRMGDCGQQLRAAAAQLSNAWEGVGGSSAVQSLETIASSVTGCKDPIQAAADKLNSVANAFEALDSGTSVPVVVPFFEQIESLLTVVRSSLPGTWDLIQFLSPTVRIVPEEVQAVAARCESIADEMRDIAKTLSSSVNSLGSSWEGKAYEKFMEGATAMILGLNNPAVSLDRFAETTRAAAIRYVELDESLS